MAQYYSAIPNSVSAKQVFECINREVVGGMDGIIVEAHGDERMADYFSVEKDIVYKACTDPEEILEKVEAGSLVGRLVLQSKEWSVSLCRNLSKQAEDDLSIPEFTFYTVGVTLISYPYMKDDRKIMMEYQKWLDPLEACEGNSTTGSYGKTIDVILNYRLPRDRILRFIKLLFLKTSGSFEAACGQIQERARMRNVQLDLARYGFRGLYSVFPDWPVASVSNFGLSKYEQFCAAIDSAPRGVFVSIGRCYLSYGAKDGRITRTLGGNRFQIYNTKTRRSVSVGFEQYSNEDVPVRLFSGKIRAKLKTLDISI